MGPNSPPPLGKYGRGSLDALSNDGCIAPPEVFIEIGVEELDQGIGHFAVSREDRGPRSDRSSFVAKRPHDLRLDTSMLDVQQIP